MRSETQDIDANQHPQAGRRRRHSANGAVLYAGPSEIDGAPITVIATGMRRSSSNEKTGPMLQTWILRTDMPPSEAWKSGAARSICGDRALRNGACYVVLHQGPRSVFSSYRKGLYRHADDFPSNWLRHRVVRFGSYGDPAAAPVELWQKLAERAGAFTGYTHQWRTPGWSVSAAVHGKC